MQNGYREIKCLALGRLHPNFINFLNCIQKLIKKRRTSFVSDDTAFPRQTSPDAVRVAYRESCHPLVLLTRVGATVADLGSDLAFLHQGRDTFH